MYFSYASVLCTLSTVLVHSAPVINSATPASTSTSRTYSTVTGYFLQDDESTDDNTFNPAISNFGLKPQSGKNQEQSDWQAFASKVVSLNSNAPEGTSYKVAFFGRHGEGWHNVAQAYYGDIKWGLYWGEKDGNGTVIWKDAHLTPNGIQQAMDLSAAWSNQITVAGTPAPQSYYVSPLDRTCATANLTFSTLPLPKSQPFVPTIKENLREQLGVFTCDQRSNKTYIASQFPSYQFENGFAEDDELWKSYWLELPNQLDDRVKVLLDDVWQNDNNTWLSFTSHQGTIGAFMRVLGHRTWSMGTGAVIPVLIKAQA